MNRFFFIILAGLWTGLCTDISQAATVSYLIDPTHTFVTWEVKHFNTSTSRGRFSVKGGAVALDREAGTGQADIAVDILSVNTGVPALDANLKGDEYFATQYWTEAHFIATDFKFIAGQLKEVKGNLTLLDQTQPVTLKATSFNCYLSVVLRREVCGGDFEATLSRGLFGIKGGMPFVGDQVHLLIQIEAVKQ